jgi:hypothetical protein
MVVDWLNPTQKPEPNPAQTRLGLGPGLEIVTCGLVGF